MVSRFKRSQLNDCSSPISGNNFPWYTGPCGLTPVIQKFLRLNKRLVSCCVFHITCLPTNNPKAPRNNRVFIVKAKGRKTAGEVSKLHLYRDHGREEVVSKSVFKLDSNRTHIRSRTSRGCLSPMLTP